MLIAALIATSQIATALIFSPDIPADADAREAAGSLTKAYSRLCAWDCAWYSSIVKNGYISTDPPVPQDPLRSNVAFFPAFPLGARFLHLLLGLNPGTALLAVAGAFAVVFWYSLGLFLRALGIPPPARALACFATYCHPAAFFLVAGYSESLFLASMLLFLYFGLKNSERDSGRAGAAGFLMSSSRIVGIPLAILPLVFGRRRAAAFAIAATTAAGGLSFLVYCLLRFGDFDLYMETQRIGWGVVPDYAAVLHWSGFRYRFPIDRVATIASGLGFLVLAFLESALIARNQRTGFWTRAPLHAGALILFLITLSGLESVQFQSMIRYSLPWYCLIVVSSAHLFTRATDPLRPKTRRIIGAFSAALVFSGCSAMLITAQWPGLRDFLEGRWFA